MIVAISQPEHFPYLGYFQKMAACDRFILLDDVPFQGTGSFQCRNRLRNPNGQPEWFGAAVARGASQQLLMDVQVAPDTGWRRKLSRKLDFHIRDRTLRDEVARAYDSPELCAINLRSVALLAARLGVHTPTVRSSALAVGGSKTARVVNLCLAVGATTYLSGPGARGYLDAEAFAEAGLSLRFFAPEVPDHLSALAHV